MQRLQPGDPEVVGRFRLVGRLGEGGMGRVYLGRTPEGAQAAVKVIRDDLAGDTGFRHRFRREVSAATSVAGMFTARVLDADPEADPPWLATQYVQGPSLRELVARHGPLDGPSQHRLALGLAEALSAIHAAGLVHRDLKPANVLLAADGAKVIDFGIAHTTGATQLTGTGEMIGTPEYMSPEQVNGSTAVGPPSDVFAMGSTLCFAATGRGPFTASSPAAVLYRILEAEPDVRALAPSVRGVAEACLAKDPARRPTAPQLAYWLRTGEAPTRTIAVPRRRRRPLLVAGAVVAGLLLAGGATATALTLANGQGAAPVTTTNQAQPPAGTPGPTVAPESREARYVERLCAGGDLLSTLAGTAGSPQPSDDPAVLRQEYLATTTRTISVLDVALADYEVLRDEAPTPQVRATFEGVIAEFTSARESLVAGQQAVEAADPLTVPAYQEGIDHYGDAVGDLQEASALVGDLELPDEYQAARVAAPSCQDG